MPSYVCRYYCAWTSLSRIYHHRSRFRDRYLRHFWATHKRNRNLAQHLRRFCGRADGNYRHHLAQLTSDFRNHDPRQPNGEIRRQTITHYNKHHVLVRQMGSLGLKNKPSSWLFEGVFVCVWLCLPRDVFDGCTLVPVAILRQKAQKNPYSAWKQGF